MKRCSDTAEFGTWTKESTTSKSATMGANGIPENDV